MYLMQYMLIYFVLWFLQLRFVNREEKQYPQLNLDARFLIFISLSVPKKLSSKDLLQQSLALKMWVVPQASATSTSFGIKAFMCLLCYILQCHYMLLKVVNCAVFKQRPEEQIIGQICHGGTQRSQSQWCCTGSSDFSSCGLFCTCTAMN